MAKTLGQDQIEMASPLHLLSLTKAKTSCEADEGLTCPVLPVLRVSHVGDHGFNTVFVGHRCIFLDLKCLLAAETELVVERKNWHPGLYINAWKPSEMISGSNGVAEIEWKAQRHARPIVRPPVRLTV
jgi:hypothetical protein